MTSRHLATFGFELDRTSQSQLDRGYRLTELLKQGLHDPMPVEEQVVIIYAGVKGIIDDVAVEDVSRFEAALRQHLRTAHADMLEQIKTTGQMPEDDKLVAAINEIKVGFTVGPCRRCAGGLLSDGRRQGGELRGRIRSIQRDEKDPAGDGTHRRVADRPRPRPHRWVRSVCRRHRSGAFLELLVAQAKRPVSSGRPEHPENVLILVALAGDRGQAGAYNTSVFRQAERLMGVHAQDGRTNKLVTIGRKGIGYFRYRGPDAGCELPGCPTGRPSRTPARSPPS